MNFKDELIEIRYLSYCRKSENDKAEIRNRIKSAAKSGYSCCMTYEWICDRIEVMTIDDVVYYIINDLDLTVERKDTIAGDYKYLSIRWAE